MHDMQAIHPIEILHRLARQENRRDIEQSPLTWPHSMRAIGPIPGCICTTAGFSLYRTQYLQERVPAVSRAVIVTSHTVAAGGRS